MKDLNKQMHLETDSLDEFEQQLRSLAPRDANIELASVLAAAPVAVWGTNQPSAEFPVAPAIHRVPWAAALLLTWSLGAAAGIGGTLVCMRWLPLNAPAVAQAAEETPAEESTAETVDVPSAANVELSPGASSAADLSGRTPIERLKAAPASANVPTFSQPAIVGRSAWGWPLGNWSERAVSSRRTANAATPPDPLEFATAYTSHSPSWRAGLLDPFVLSRSQLSFSGAPSARAIPAVHVSPSEAAPTAIEAGRMDPSQVLPFPPTNQRDLLQQLLSSQRAI